MDCSTTLPEDTPYYDDEGYSTDESLNDALDFSEIPFYGRSNQLLSLNAVYDELREKSENRSGDSPSVHELVQVQVTLICGTTGTGKSALVAKFIEDLKQDQHDAYYPHCVTGKYSDCLGITTDPFSAIIEALGGFFKSLGRFNATEFERIRNDIISVLGPDEVDTLTSLIPDFHQRSVSSKRRRSSTLSNLSADAKLVCGDTIPGSPGNSTRNAHQSGGWNRLKYIFQTLFQIICTKKHPIIIFLDDLQWADDASVALIESLLTDKSISHAMFVGTIRPNKLKKNHLLRNSLESIAKVRKVERMNVDDLTIEETGQFLAKILGLTPEDIGDLGEKIFERTLGNYFFMTQTLQDLDKNNVLYYSHISFRWEWDIDRVETGLSDNVLDVVVLNLQSIPEKVQKALSVAAYTRSTFDIGTIETLLKDLAYISDSDDLKALLDIAIGERLISYDAESKVYIFTHDRIKKAACLLVPSGDQRQNLRAALGTCLWRIGVTDEGDDWMLFVAADHLNGNKSANLDLIFMVGVNVLVGRTALVMGAYVEASSYLEKGIELLKQIDNYWEERYDLSMQLYQAYASSELYRGHIDKGGVISHIVLKNAKGLRDQLPIFLTLTVVYGQLENHSEGLRLSRTVLKKLNAYPSSFYGHYSSLWLRHYFSNNSDDAILQLQPMCNDTKIATMRFICQAIVRAHFCSKQKTKFRLAICGIRMTLEHGLCGESALCLTVYACCIVNGQFKRSLRLAHLAQKILDQSNSKGVGGWSIVTSTVSISPWNDDNISRTTKMFRTGYRYGMESGDIEVAILNRVCAIAHSLVLGYSLIEVNKAIEETMEHLIFYSLKASKRILMEYMTLLCLTSSSRPDFEDLGRYETENETASNGKVLKVGCLFRLLLGVHFGEYNFAQTMVKKMASMISDSYAYQILCWSYSFFTAAGLARQTGKAKYRYMAQKIANQIKGFPRSDNFSSIYLLMKAELTTMRSKLPSITTIQSAYDQAICALLKAGYIQYAALACDFAGEYFLTINEEDLCGKYFSQAKMCYEEWGSKSLSDHLQEKITLSMSYKTSKAFLSEYVNAKGNPGLLAFHANEPHRLDSRRCLNIRKRK